jgi:branched-chain amino acid transport system ATP-binding protein
LASEKKLKCLKRSGATDYAAIRETTNMNEIILETRNLRKAFGGLQAVNSVNLRIARGGCSSIIGPNGAGKSTLFNLISGYYPPTDGDVVFQGTTITPYSVQARCRAGMARSFQLISIFPALTVYENVLISVLARRRKTMRFFVHAKRYFKDKVDFSLESIGLFEQKNVAASELALGDQKRLELAVVLSQEPSLLLLDEPTAGMSPVERVATMELLQQLAEEKGVTILLTEHDMTLVFAISRWIGVLDFGLLIAEGPPEAIKGNEQVRKIYLGE